MTCDQATREGDCVDWCNSNTQYLLTLTTPHLSLITCLDVLRPGSVQASEGYCVIDDASVPPGLVPLLQDDDINVRYAYPASFDSLDVYFKWSAHLRPPVPVSITQCPLSSSPTLYCTQLSFSIMPESRNRTVLDDPRPTNGAPLTGIALDGTVGNVFYLSLYIPSLSLILSSPLSTFPQLP